MKRGPFAAYQMKERGSNDCENDRLIDGDSDIQSQEIEVSNAVLFKSTL